MHFKKVALFLFLFFFSFTSIAKPTIVVGSKRFTENYILAEIFAQLLEGHGYPVERKFSMGGTMPTFFALEYHEVDVYPEYTGTLSQAVFKFTRYDLNYLEKELKEYGLKLLKPLGLNNSYCILMNRKVADDMKIKSISDLSKFPHLIGAVSSEFKERKDGWPNLRNVYHLENQVLNFEVPLNYQALKDGRVGFSEGYTTEPFIKTYDFVILEDDQKFFPDYFAVPLVHTDVPIEVQDILNELGGQINNEMIRSMNHTVNEGKASIAAVANDFLIENKLIDPSRKLKIRSMIPWLELYEQTKTHLFLTFIAVALATLVAVPIGSLIVGHNRLSSAVLTTVGILQTIPSIALLTFMIPLFGIGFKPAIVGLFIYSLLPILRNTYTAMSNIDPRLILSARGIGLYPSEIFFRVKFPLALPTILAGIRTAATLNIGTATLAAFIGAGGLGVPIVSGLALNDTNMVLRGAIPAALLAILVDGLFSVLDKFYSKKI